jgi:hypothetical protein
MNRPWCSRTVHDVPMDLDELRCVVQGLLLHRDWAPSYGVTGDAIRIHEQSLQSTTDLLNRALEISAEPVTVPRPPRDRVLCICRHFTLLRTALLRAQAVPSRARCGFSNYFDSAKWYDRWITERWDGERWVRDDAQIDDLQAEAVKVDCDPHDQPPGGSSPGARRGSPHAPVRSTPTHSAYSTCGGSPSSPATS